MGITDAQRKTLKRLQIGNCEYLDIMRAGGNGTTIHRLLDKRLIEEYKVFGSRFWRITEDGRKAIS